MLSLCSLCLKKKSSNDITESKVRVKERAGSVCVYSCRDSRGEAHIVLRLGGEMGNKAAQLNGTICKNGRLGHVAMRVHITRDPRGQSQRCLQSTNYSLQFQMPSFTNEETWTEKGIHTSRETVRKGLWIALLVFFLLSVWTLCSLSDFHMYYSDLQAGVSMYRPCVNKWKPIKHSQISRKTAWTCCTRTYSGQISHLI